MKPNTQSILERCIADGLESALLDTELPLSQQHQLLDKLVNRIWFEIDLYFDFETN